MNFNLVLLQDTIRTIEALKFYFPCKIKCLTLFNGYSERKPQASWVRAMRLLFIVEHAARAEYFKSLFSLPANLNEVILKATERGLCSSLCSGKLPKACHGNQEAYITFSFSKTIGHYFSLYTTADFQSY